MIKNLLLLIASFILFTSFNSSGGFGGDKNNGESYISVSPNPVKDRAHVYCTFYINKFEVFNLVGTTIGNYNGGEMIDLTNHSRGYYLIKVYTPQGEFIKRIYKE
jgi:hypothetical protein